MPNGSEHAREDRILVPNSGIQFMTFDIDIDGLARFDRTFIEHPEASGDTDDSGAPLYDWVLLQGWNPENEADDPPHQPAGLDEAYSINRQRALEPFLRKWVPVPYLRVDKAAIGTQAETYDDGPTNWVRVRVTEKPRREGPGSPTHTVTFAFDTAIEDYGPAAATTGGTAPYVPYTEPKAEDIINPRTFTFVSDMRHLVRFLSDRHENAATGAEDDYQRWVVEWLQRLFVEFKEASLARRLKPSDIRFKLEHAARWIAFLELIRLTVAPPKVRFVDTISEGQRFQPVDVDLILDVGNSRTCGILIEDLPNADRIGIDACMTLQLRDVAEPQTLYTEPFESHVEFSQAAFGIDNLSRDSGRERAFFWPSLVRVGPEATRLRNRSGGNDSLCGMSSPKRYLWDVAEQNQAWRFPSSDYIGTELPPIGRRVRRFLNTTGDVLSGVSPRERKLFDMLYPGRRWENTTRETRALTFSRSSLYTFMLAEVIWQAYVMINNPEIRLQRNQSEVPRRLRRIVITLPTAVPTREQRIMRYRAESAVRLIFDLMDWTRNLPPGVQRPQVEVAWDEASCVQFVWLYGEITQKYGGNIRGFFDLRGRPRQRFSADNPPLPGARPESSLRVASLDIGGGTTDLMITTYFQEDNTAIDPVLTFRESFRKAGDDVTRAVIERAVVPAFTEHLRNLGLRQARDEMRQLFAGNHGNITVQESNLRRQFVQRIFLPAALALMSAYERMEDYDYGRAKVLTLAELSPEIATVAASTRAYLADHVERRGVRGFDLLEVPITVDFDLIRKAIDETLRDVIANLCEAINHFDCDVVLLSGRPSKMAAITEMVVDRLAVAPNKVVPMHRYRPGPWYPFRSVGSTLIGDPKTTAVVGGMLCALSDRRLRKFALYTKNLQMRSTARYIGILERNLKLEAENVLFTDADWQNPSPSGHTRTVRYHTEVMIGFRQLPHARWTASALYRLHEDKNGASLPTPIAVTLERSTFEGDDEPDRVLERESAKEELRIAEAISVTDQINVSKSLYLSLNTMGDTEPYWMDTGLITV